MLSEVTMNKKKSVSVIPNTVFRNVYVLFSSNAWAGILAPVDWLVFYSIISVI